LTFTEYEPGSAPPGTAIIATSGTVEPGLITIGLGVTLQVDTGIDAVQVEEMLPE
jgi:hypothetical protein